MKKKALKIIWVFIIILIVLGLVVPIVWPVPTLADVKPAEQLADADSLFVKVKGINIHYKRAGQGDTAMLLLHGFGASVFSWREVLIPLSKMGAVIAYDRPAFGLTQRPMPGEWSGGSPYSLSAQVEMLVGLMDQLNIKQAILCGNSAGGTVAMATAIKYPERVQGLMLVDAAIYGGSSSAGWQKLLFSTPQMRRLGPLLVRSIAETGNDTIYRAWHDPSRVTPAILEGYRKPLKVENWDRALWEYQLAMLEPRVLSQHLGELKMPVMVVTGDDDRIVPTELSLRLGSEIPGAKLTVFKNCGHVPQEECPEQFLAAVSDFLISNRRKN